MKIIITEEQFNKIPEGDMPIGLKRRIHNVDNVLKSVLKYYDVDEYNRFDFIDEVLRRTDIVDLIGNGCFTGS